MSEEGKSLSLVTPHSSLALTPHEILKTHIILTTV